MLKFIHVWASDASGNADARRCKHTKIYMRKCDSFGYNLGNRVTIQYRTHAKKPMNAPYFGHEMSTALPMQATLEPNINVKLTFRLPPRNP